VRTHEYAVYLSPGFRKGVRWGGYHVTVTGFSASHAAGKSQKKILGTAWHKFFRGKAWHFTKKEGIDCWFKRPAHLGWQVNFESKTLQDLATYLRTHGFKGVRKNWHVSLYGATKAGARHRLAQLKTRDWHLWLVRKPGKECQLHGKGCRADAWEQIK
jgi:hypothetical protein